MGEEIFFENEIDFILADLKILIENLGPWGILEKAEAGTGEKIFVRLVSDEPTRLIWEASIRPEQINDRISKTEAALRMLDSEIVSQQFIQKRRDELDRELYELKNAAVSLTRLVYIRGYAFKNQLLIQISIFPQARAYVSDPNSALRKLIDIILDRLGTPPISQEPPKADVKAVVELLATEIQVEESQGESLSMAAEKQVLDAELPPDASRNDDDILPDVKTMKNYHENYSHVTAREILDKVPIAYERHEREGERWGPGIIAKCVGLHPATVGRYLNAFRKASVTTWKGIPLPGTTKLA